MRFHKFISTILHPIVIPTLGVMLYFLLIPINLSSDKKFSILSLIFISSYLIPLLVLVLLKKFKFIKNFQTESIKERKLPVALMIFLFYFLGNTMNNIPSLRDLSLLFYATSIGLIIIYILFFFKIKASIHLLSLSIPTGFFLVLSTNYSQSYILVIIILIILSGILASARLHLKAHNRTEVYIGFFLGLITPIVLNYIL
ncbi:hypothetical protein BW723_02565 [Polaribacter reichenbachii]|uniref:PA-phosphatase n=1 Tax=Polaribacter reichenbachii TaxID=996801 RepID=A0A1B8TVE1_9FLAO|nr:hypothetical protein [Polaribacter reichenbachii]APZ45245.1 hypothetical protein BW723_02565 [Polaribacter reichenbachii]AUC19108.1 hypothetical protein BTO17_10570 [Polaribacter reichenbachii]OBY63736.1 hypothetical protein LPB301_13135 [Polaribacter reichenbachii]